MVGLKDGSGSSFLENSSSTARNSSSLVWYGNEYKELDSYENVNI